MAATLTQQQMSRRIERYANELSFNGMSNACAVALRPVRRYATRKNFGFVDKTGKTRKNIGKIRKYKPTYAHKRGGGGAYFRGGSIAAVRLEYDYGGKYRFLRPALGSAFAAVNEQFTIAARAEIVKAEQYARRIIR